MKGRNVARAIFLLLALEGQLRGQSNSLATNLVPGTLLPVTESQQREVTRVMTALPKVAKACMRTNQVRGLQVTFDEKGFLAALHGASTSNCPPQFQLAWLDYVQFWERRNAQTGLQKILPAFQTIEGVIVPMTAPAEAEKIAKEQSEATDLLYFQKLQRVALEFGVQPVR